MFDLIEFLKKRHINDSLEKEKEIYCSLNFNEVLNNLLKIKEYVRHDNHYSIFNLSFNDIEIDIIKYEESHPPYIKINSTLKYKGILFYNNLIMIHYNRELILYVNEKIIKLIENYMEKEFKIINEFKMKEEFKIKKEFNIIDSFKLNKYHIDL